MNGYSISSKELALRTACRFLKQNAGAASLIGIPQHVLQNDCAGMSNNQKASLTHQITALGLFAERIEEMGVEKFEKMEIPDKLEMIRAANRGERYDTPHDSGDLKGTLSRLRAEAQRAEAMAEAQSGRAI